MLLVGLSAAVATDGRASASSVPGRIPPGRIAVPTLAPPATSPTPVVVAAFGRRYPWTFPRATEDRPDVRLGRTIHVVYLLPSDFHDEGLDTLGVIEDSMRSQNHWFREQTGDREWRLDTYRFDWDDPETPDSDPRPIEAVDVTFVRSNLPGERLNDIDEVDSELISRGLRDQSKRYVAYVASNAGSLCGEAWYELSNGSAPVDGRYSAVFLNSDRECRTRRFATGPADPAYTEAVVMQEMIHNDGMVPMPAAHGCGPTGIFLVHVCLAPVALVSPGLDPDHVDVMFPFVGLPLGQKVLDRDRDDYFRHPLGTPDLDDGYYLETVER